MISPVHATQTWELHLEVLYLAMETDRDFSPISRAVPATQHWKAQRILPQLTSATINTAAALSAISASRTGVGSAPGCSSPAQTHCQAPHCHLFSLLYGLSCFIKPQSALISSIILISVPSFPRGTAAAISEKAKIKSPLAFACW